MLSKGPGPDGASTVAVPGVCHYRASVKHPYLNGSMRGVVTVMDDQIDPQTRASSPRAALPPLRGAKITGFSHVGGVTGIETDTARSHRSVMVTTVPCMVSHSAPTAILASRSGLPLKPSNSLLSPDWYEGARDRLACGDFVSSF